MRLFVILRFFSLTIILKLCTELFFFTTHVHFLACRCNINYKKKKITKTLLNTKKSLKGRGEGEGSFHEIENDFRITTLCEAELKMLRILNPCLGLESSTQRYPNMVNASFISPLETSFYILSSLSLLVEADLDVRQSSLSLTNFNR